jgi:hypothetical protein
MQRRWFVALAVMLLVLTAGATLPASGTNDIDTGVSPARDSPQLSTPQGFNNTEFRLTVFENGTTRWTISHYRFLGDNESRIDQYQTFAQEFNTTETDTYRDFKTRARALTAFGSDATNRQMNATAFSKAAYIEQQFRGKVGVLEMSFSWTNFAEVTDSSVIVGDVFEGGMYVGPNQSLVFERPSSLVFENATPSPDVLGTENNLTASTTLEYQGEQDFVDRNPRVVLVSPETLNGTTNPPAADETETPSTTTQTATPAKSNEFGPIPLVVAILLLLVVGGGIAWYTGTLGSVAGDRSDTDAGATAATETESTADPETPAEAAVPEEELLSDEDRVLSLLDDNGGRMKQVNIVENTEWSKSKVSMLLSDMEEEGLISKLRVGRENIISKAGEEPDAVGSPFDDE